MLNKFSRTELLLGDRAMKKLAGSRVAVFGLGGVGGYAVEALARSGIGALDIVDDDAVSLTNINRQLIATVDTVGQPKVDLWEKRIHQINPDCLVRAHRIFFLPETADSFNFGDYDYVVDAIDTVAGKLQLVLAAREAGVPIISSMGAGNKLDPTAFEVADIYRTSVCPLAKAMRRELRKLGVDSLKVVYSRELPVRSRPAGEAAVSVEEPKGTTGRPSPGSIAFVPSVAGLILAGEVIKDLTLV